MGPENRDSGTRPENPELILTLAMVRAILEFEIRRPLRQMNTDVIDLCTQALSYGKLDVAGVDLDKAWSALTVRNEAADRRKAAVQQRRRVALLAVLLLVLLAAVCIATGIIPWLQHVLWDNDRYYADIGIAAAVLGADAPVDYGEALGEAFTDALDEQGMSVRLPGWLPAGFALEDVSVSELQDTWVKVFAVYRGEAGVFTVTVNWVTNEDGLLTLDVEKDDATLELYTSRGRQVSIFENLGRLCALYIEQPYTVVIMGDVSRDDLKKMIDSVEEEPK